MHSQAADTSVDADEASEDYAAGPLGFRDFVPKQLSDFGVFKVAEYESFHAAVAAANRWIRDSGVEVIQLETVVLPNIWSKYEEGSIDASIGASGGMTSHWHQFLRVWYRNDAEV